jgi:hypothetical protein
VLIAGHKRYAALAKLGRTEIRAEVRSGESEHAERAAENVVRTQLNPYEEARAVAAMRASGLTEDGAAQALGWPKARVTARMRLLELPEAAQQMVGAGTIALSSVEQLRAIGQVSPPLLDALITYLADGNQFAAERLAREPGWVIDAVLRETDSKLDRYSYGVDVRFAEVEVDQARAAGVVIEFERGAPLIVDRSLYRELVKQAVARTATELEARVAERTTEQRADRVARAQLPVDPAAQARRDEQRAVRAIAERAHGVNLDIGAGLLNGLATVDPSDMTVARFFALGLLGADYDQSPYTQTGDRVTRLAMSGIRLVIEEFRSDVTKTRKDGSRGALRIDYGDPHQPEAAIAWMWKFIDGARSAGELYGRVLVVICAEQYASRLVVPQSQRTPETRWSSHKDQAAKALKKLAGPHLPASLKELDRAITRAHRDYETAADQTRQPAGSQPPDGESQCDQPSDTEVDVDDEDAREDEDEPGL